MTELIAARYPWNQHFLINILTGQSVYPHATSCSCPSACSSCSELGYLACFRNFYPSSCAQGSHRSHVPRCLRPRSSLDCPVCYRTALPEAAQEPKPAPVRPWRAVKSRRGASKRAHRVGSLSEPSLPVLHQRGAHPGRRQRWEYREKERIPRCRCQVCRTVGVAQLHTTLYRLKTPSPQVALVLSALAEGLDGSAAERVFGGRLATNTRWLVRAGAHAQTRPAAHLLPVGAAPCATG